jgi:hypothetical protein
MMKNISYQVFCFIIVFILSSLTIILKTYLLNRKKIMLTESGKKKVAEINLIQKLCVSVTFILKFYLFCKYKKNKNRFRFFYFSLLKKKKFTNILNKKKIIY